MAHRSALVLVLAVASLFIACDKAGVYPLGVPRDVVEQCSVQSTWMRSVEREGAEGEPSVATEVFVIGVTDPTNIDMELDAAGAEGVCFNFGTVEKNSTTSLYVGRLKREGTAYQVDVRHLYTFVYEPERSMFQRQGAKRVDYDEPIEVVADFEVDGEQLLVTYDGDPRRLTRIEDVIARLDPDETDLDAPGGPKDIYRMFNLSLFMGQPRIASFGAVGMTTYVTPAEFLAFIDGRFTIGVASLTRPDVSIEYFETQEIGGVVVDGLQMTFANISGEGTMSGVLEVDFYTDPARAEDPYFTAYVDYADVIIDRGVAADGTYTLTVSDQDFILDYDIASDEDFTAILPISEGVP